MKCPMCDHDRIHKLGKTFKGNLRYKCLACHAVFTDRPEVDRYPLKVNFLHYRDRRDRPKNRKKAISANEPAPNRSQLLHQFITPFKFLAKKQIVSEIIIIFLLWLASVVISRPIFSRPLDITHHEWLTAHTLVSMRAFDQWGFWKLLGASVLTPKSYEYLNSDITIFTRFDGVYLSYPSFWLILPYLAIKFLELFHLGIDISISSLQTYHLVVNRLICGVVIYYLYLEVINILAKPTLTLYIKRLIAFIGLIGWMFAPPVLYWTQNVYLSDQAVLLPIYALFLVAIKCKFDFDSLSKLGEFSLFSLSIYATGCDWYGWVSVAILGAICLIRKFFFFLRQKSISKSSVGSFLVGYFNSIKYLLLSTVITSLIFLAQLIYYKDGFRQIASIFLLRVGTADDGGKQLSSEDMVRGILAHWTSYLPQRIEPIFADIIDKSKNFNVMDVFLVAIAIISLLLALYYLYKKSQDKQIVIYTYVLIFFAPLSQIYLLRQHSYVHDFSAFKIGLPVAFSLIVLPIITLNHLLSTPSDSLDSGYRQTNIAFSAFVVSLGLAIIFSSGDRLIGFAKQTGNYNQELGVLIQKNVAQTDLPISEELWVGPNPPQPLWYTNRFIYVIDQLKDLKTKTDPEILKTMTPVFLAYADSPPESPAKSRVNAFCQNQWEPLAQKLSDREVVICRSEELRRLLD
jgi:hypothetical protein